MGFTNRDRLRRRLKAIPVEVRRGLKAQNAANAVELVQTQRGFVAVDEMTLHDSIRSQDVSTSTRISHAVSAGGTTTTKPVRQSEKGGAPEYDYALGVEYGTEDAPAQPFFWPAWRSKRRKFKSRMSRAAKKAIAAAVTK